jgi:hypothetical protein
MLLILSQALIAGAACCSSGAFTPSLLSPLEKAQIGTRLSAASVVGESTNQGDAVFFHDEESNRSVSQSFFAAYRIHHEWSLGLTSGWTSREKRFFDRKESSLSPTDTYLSLTHEIDAWWSLTASLLIPTAKSALESGRAMQSDAEGRGLWTPSLSVRHQDNKNFFDYSASLAVRWSAPGSFENPQRGQVSVEPAAGFSAQTGGGYQWKWASLRTGVSVAVHGDQGWIERDRFQTTRLKSKWVWDLSLEASAPLSDSFLLAAAYTDQTLLGPTQNASLSRSLSFMVSHLWSL